MTTKSTKKPSRVTIALPVYNGAESIERAIKSVLNQTFKDYALIVLDNQSTDETRKICTHYARLDNRITYIQNSSNLGAMNNFSKGLSLAKTEFFCWLAHDDERDPEYLKELIFIMDERPDIGMSAARVVVVNPDGQSPDIIKSIPADRMNGSSYSACLWFLIMHHWWYSKADFIYGLYRTSLLKKTFGIPQLPGEDIGGDVLFVYSYMAKYGIHISSKPLLLRHSKYFFPLKSTVNSQKYYSDRLRALIQRNKSSTQAINKFYQHLRNANQRFPMHQRVVLDLLALWYAFKLRTLFS